MMAKIDTLKTRRIQSHPSFLPKSTLSRCNSSLEIVILSDAILTQIFSNLTYRELTSVRAVCRWFYHVVGKMMNDKFKLSSAKMKNELIQERKCRRSAILMSVTVSEIEIIEAHISYYMDECMFYFYGGAMLDYIDFILACRNEDDCVPTVAHISTLANSFLASFDQVSEPKLLEKSYHLPFSWFGKKLFDILHCYAKICHVVSVEPLGEGRHFRWAGNFMIGQVDSLSSPPFLRNTLEGTKKELDSILKWLRDHIRWNNILYMIKNCGRGSKPFEKRISLDENNVKIIFEKSHPDFEIDEAGGQKLAVKIGLYSHAMFAPTRYSELSGMLDNFTRKPQIFEEGSSVSESDASEPAVPEKQDYEMDLKMELTYREHVRGRDLLKKTTLQICNVENKCFIASNTAAME